MTSNELLALWRAHVQDTVQPYLWSDAEAYGYMDAAQRKWCQLTDGIPDASNRSVTELAVIADSAAFIKLHQSVKLIREVYRSDTGAQIDVVNRQDMGPRGWRFDGATGPVKALIIGEENNKCRTYPVPNETITLKLLVFRGPINAIDGTGIDLEIPTDYQYDLQKYMDHLAYAKEDTEAFDLKRSERADNAFNAACADAEESERRKRHKSRTTSYGGI